MLPDGNSAYYVDGDGRLRPYDLDTGALDDPFPALGSIRDPQSVLAGSPDGSLLAQAAWSGQGNELTTTIGIFDTSTGALQFPPVVVDGGVTGATFTRGHAVLAVSVFPTLASSPSTRQPVFRSPTAPGVAVPDNQTAASGIVTVGEEVVIGAPYKGTLRVFDATTFQLRRTITVPPMTVSHLRDVGDGTVITAGSEGLAGVDIDTGDVIWRRQGLEMCADIAVVAARDRFFCGNIFGRLEERDLETGLVLRRLDAQNGNAGMLWPARGGRELVSFGANEPVVSRGGSMARGRSPESSAPATTRSSSAPAANG